MDKKRMSGRDRWHAIVPVLCISMFVLLAIRLLADAFGQQATRFGSPLAVNGVIDLRRHDFRADGPVRLDGEWRFIWNGQSLDGNGNHTTLMMVPGAWNGMHGNPDLPDFGNASYHLRILLPSDSGKLSIRTGSIRMANAITINGRLAGGSGSISYQGRTGYRMDNTPVTIGLDVTQSMLDLAIRVSNHDYMAGGIVQSIFLGLPDDIAAQASREIVYYAIMGACLLMSAGIHLILFSGHAHRRRSLFFSLYALLFAIYLSGGHAKPINQMYPNLSPYATIVIQNAAMFGSIAFLALFARTVCRRLMPQWLWLVFFGSEAGYAVLILFIPFPVSSRFQLPFLLIGMAEYLWVALAFLWRALKREETDTMPQRYWGYSLAFGLVLLFFLNAFLFNANALREESIGHIALAGFVLVIAWLLSMELSDSYHEQQRLNVLLAETDHKKDRFLAEAAVELGYPLSGIVNLSESILHGSDSIFSAGAKEDLLLIGAVGRRLSRLVEDLRERIALGEGKVSLACTAVNMKTCVETALHLLSYDSEWENIIFHNRIPGQCPPVFGDHGRLMQILYNLLDHAMRNESAAMIAFTAEVEGEMLVTEMRVLAASKPSGGSAGHGSDNPPSKAKTDVLSADRTNLRLDIAQHLIGLHHGAYEVCRGGDGSSSDLLFRFSLPLAKTDEVPVRESITSPAPDRADLEQSALRHAPDPSSPIAGESPPEQKEEPIGHNRTYRIFVADATVQDRKLLERLLSTPEAVVHVFQDGASLLAACQRFDACDLVVLPPGLPMHSGLDVVRELRRNHTALDLPILLLTSRTRPEEARSGWLAGVNDHLDRPFDLQELHARVRTLAGLRKAVRDRIDTEIAFLSAQIRPHFIFNALNVIVAILEYDPEKAKSLLYDVSDFLRGGFDFEVWNPLVPLARELRTVEAYLSIERARFGDRLRIVYALAHQEDVLVPVLAVQTLVENAVRHGVLLKEAGGTVQIRTDQQAGGVRISVLDDGPGMQAHAETDRRKGIGISNVNARLQDLFGQTLHVDTVPSGGTHVSFLIPFSHPAAAERFRHRTSIPASGSMEGAGRPVSEEHLHQQKGFME